MLQLKILGSIAILFGGGQIPQANFLMGEIIMLLIERVNTIIYGIHASYKGLISDKAYERMSIEKAKSIKKQIGTYFSTCRSFDPASDEYFDLILNQIISRNIKILFVTGGDGSARALKDLAKRLRQANCRVNIIFIPCTIDGLTGSIAIGIKAAVNESLRRIKLIAVNAFATFDNGLKGSRIAIVEMQGRNRDDILLTTFDKLLKSKRIGKFKISEINIFLIPSSWKWSIIDLLNKVQSLDTPTLILVSEGAKPTEGWFEQINGSSVAERISNMINSNKIRKSNYDVVGYLSQSNDCIDKEQKQEIIEWAKFSIDYIIENEKKNNSYATAIVKREDGLQAISLEELVSLNPNSKDTVPLSLEKIEELKNYLI